MINRILDFTSAGDPIDGINYNVEADLNAGGPDCRINREDHLNSTKSITDEAGCRL